jgi:hypothetical protein
LRVAATHRKEALSWWANKMPSECYSNCNVFITLRSVLDWRRRLFSVQTYEMYKHVVSKWVLVRKLLKSHMPMTEIYILNHMSKTYKKLYLELPYPF